MKEEKTIKEFRIVLDGLSGVGKTTLAKKLFSKYRDRKITFFEDVIFRDEITSTKEHIKSFKEDYNIIQDSIPLTILVKQFLCNYGYLSKKDFEKCLKLYNKNLNQSLSYLHILLYSDDRSIIHKNRIKRGREYEYKHKFVHIDELDDFLEDNLETLYKKHNINYLKFNVNDEDDINELQKLINSIIIKKDA